MSMVNALLWRSRFFLFKTRGWIIFYILVSTFWMMLIVPLMGVNPEKVKSSETLHVKQDFPRRSREEVLMALKNDTQLMVFPKNEQSNKLISVVQKHHSKLTVDFWNNQSDIVDIGGEGVLRIVFHEISPNKLDYSVFIKKDLGIFPLSETPGPGTSDDDLMSAGHPAIQLAVDEAYMEMFGIPRQEWNIRKNPYPAYSSIDSTVGPILDSSNIWYVIMFGLFGIIARYGQTLVEEKTSGIGELLAIYGISNFHSQISWFLTFSLVFLTTTILHTLVISYPIFGYVLFLKTSIWVVLLVLMSYYQTSLVFTTLFSIFCTNPTNCGIVLSLFFLGNGALIRVLDMKHQSNFVLRMTCLLPVGGLHQCISAVFEFEKAYQGVQIDNFFSQPPVTYNLLSVGESIMFMIAGSLFTSVLLIYFNMVWPRKYGTTKPWYFPCPFLPKRLKSPCPRKEPTVNPATPTSAVREEVENETPVVVEVQQIHKSYGRVKALNGVSMDIYANQITALLGENGAGKTTLLGIITGMLTPTQGTILVQGQDISKGDNLKNFRRNIGYCPQNDLFMDYLTVQQHLIFFLLLQGADYQQANLKSIHWLDQFHLSDKKGVQVVKLSGGMKRKLTLCISLAREPTILILDEPTSGLDPVARREVWNILRKSRGERTIILTTHRMEEADVLSDYIAILSEGNLRVFGSSEFLKSKYGGEYQVSFVPLTENMKWSEFLNTIQKRFDSTSVISQSGKILVLGVKSIDAQEFLRFVETTYGNMVSISVTSGTIDDVFVQVQREDGVRISVDETALPPRNDPALHNRKSYTWSRLKLLISKRYVWTRNKWQTLLIYILICPVLSSLFAMIFPRLYNPINIKEGGITAEMRSYGETTSLISENEPTKELSNIIKSSIGLQDGTYQVIDANKNIDDALIDEAAKNLKLYRSKMIFSADLRGNLTVYYSSVATLAVPIAINMITNAMILANRSRRSITTQIFLQPMFDLELDKPNLAQKLKFWMLFLFCDGILETFSYFVIFPHEERTTLMRHLQLMTGLHWSIYWMANVLVDFVIVLCAVTTTMIFFVFWDNTIAVEPLFTQRPYFDVTIIVLILFGLSCISFAYLCSYFFRKVTWCITAYRASQLVSFVLYSMALLPLFSLIKNTGFLITKLKYFFYLVPLVPFMESLRDTLSSHKVFYMDHSTRGTFDYDETFSDLITDISVELIYLGVDFILYLIIVIFIDGGSWRRIKNCMSCSRVFYDSSKADADVLEERDRIQTLDKDNEPFLVVDNLTKSYGNYTAANGVSFIVDRGEFFGLLGLNGAGKTTTFKMLAGLVDSNGGDARIGGKSLVKDRRSYMKSSGFCPQAEGLLEPVPGKKLLELFGALRGLDGADLKTAVEKWTDILDMDKIKDRRCGEYSGGNARKLSVAMSLIGDPSIVFLDEPTTGVDPVSRRKLWSLLKRSQNLGSTFILTSHSLDECEALCDRVTIMAGGYMKCLGPIGQLKLTYSAGFKVIVGMNTSSTENDITNVKKIIDGSFQSSYSLKDEEPFMLSFEINKKDMKWSERFDFINNLKSKVPQISDVVISDSSLEQVFYNVTKPQ